MPLTIPTIYTVIDKFTAPLHRMVAANQEFVASATRGVARAEGLFKKLTPALSETTKQFFAFASAAALAGLIISGVQFSVRSLMEYENAVQSFRVIVSDLSDKDFSKFEKAIQQTAITTKRSAIDVAKAFEMIAGLQAKFAESPEAISAVTAATLTLARASRDDLGKTASNLTGILNQYELKANSAARVINVLAAGQAVGASTISETADAFTVFGAGAKAANLSVEQSVALTEVLASKQIKAAEAGTALRGTLIRLQASGLGYKSGLFNVRDALVEVNEKFNKLKTAQQKDAYIMNTFGVINQTTGLILKDNIALFDEFTKGVTGTNEAEKAAAINSNTLSIKLDELKASWINMLVTSDKASSGLNTAKNVIGFLADNMNTIVSIGSKILIFFLAWKALLLLTRAALIGYNVVLGITGALSSTASVAIGANAVALAAYKATAVIATAAQWALNVAMTANPIGLIIVGIAALIAIVALVISKWNEWGAAVSLFLGPLGLVISLIQSFRRNWDMIVKAFKTGGVLAALKAIGATLLDAVLMPIQQIVSIIAKVTGAEWAENAVKGIEAFRQKLGVNVETDESGNPLPAKPVISPKAEAANSFQETLTTNRQRVNIDINDKTGGQASVYSDDDLVPVRLSTTMGF